MKIKNIKAREILDSRGNPTVEADIVLDDGSFGRASVPSGASTGSNEAVELRDGDKSRYNGKGVMRAVDNINIEIKETICGKNISNQEEIDNFLIKLDGTENKSRLGANAILAVSLAFARAVAQSRKQELFEYIGGLSLVKREYTLPVPMCNVINGGKHADGSTDIQEFMIIPAGAKSFREALRMSAEIFHSLKKELAKRNYSTTVGDEGGYAPSVKEGNKEALILILEAIYSAGYKKGEDFLLAIDAASSEFYKNNQYVLARENKTLTSSQIIEFYEEMIREFPVISIEDGLAEDDWQGWVDMTKKLGEKIQLVGDDLLVTNVKFLDRAIKEKAGNSILIKVNQIGTLTETIKTVNLAQKNGWNTIISHRSGETEDAFISHIAVGLGSGQIKTGSLSRSERIAKYNELLRIEEYLDKKAIFAGRSVFNFSNN